MGELDHDRPVSPEIMAEAKEQVELFFSSVDQESELVAFLKERAVERVVEKLVKNPDYARDLQIPEPDSYWSGPKPKGPRDYLKRKVVLPSLPQVMIEIQGVINSPDSSADDLAKVISKDPKLVASLLRLANSAMFSFRAEVDTPSRAVALMGFRQVSSLALGAASLSLFRRSKDSILDVERFWKHSIACGVIAQEIAKKAGIGDPERFFVCGLLHDIGLYIIYESDTSLASTLQYRANEEGKSFYSLEREMLGFDHAILGGTVLKDWNFPKPLVVAAAGHHDEAKSREFHDAGLVHVAEFISRAMGYDLGLSKVLGDFSDKVWQTVNLSLDEFKEILPDINTTIESVCEILAEE